MKNILISILFYHLLTQPFELYAQYSDLIKGRNILRITVYDHPDLGTVVRVAENGTITFPLLGEIEVENLTAHQVERKIVGLLAKGIIVDPQVTVFVEQYKNKRVTVIGEVKKQGQYNLLMDKPTYVADIISTCLGLSENAGKTLTILRREEGTQKKIMVDLFRLFKDGDFSQDVELKEGDLLYVHKAAYYYIYGEVKQPGHYKIDSGLTVIKAVSKAGGFTEMAFSEGIRIVRKKNDVKKIIHVALQNPIQPGDTFFKENDMSQDIRMEDGDILYIPKVAYFYVYGEINKPGQYKKESGLTVIKAISIAGGITDKASTRSIDIIREIEGQKVTVEVEMSDPVQEEDVIIVSKSFF